MPIEISLNKIHEKYLEHLDRFEYSIEEKNMKLDYIQIKKGHKNKGIGSLIMKEIISLCEENNITLTLYPRVGNRNVYYKLRKFYRKLGLFEKFDEEYYLYFTNISS